MSVGSWESTRDIFEWLNFRQSTESAVARGGAGGGHLAPPPNNYGEKEVLIDEFSIYVSLFLKSDAFTAISGMKILKKFPLSFARPSWSPPKCFTQLWHCSKVCL